MAVPPSWISGLLPRFSVGALPFLLASTATAVASDASLPLRKVGEFRLQHPRQGAAAVVHDDCIYVFGGGAGGAITIVEKFDTRTAEVAQVDTRLMPRRYHSVLEHAGKFYLFGGPGHGLSGILYEHAVEIYDPAGNTVSRGPAMAEARSHMAAVTLGDKAYLIGGSKLRDNDRVQTNETSVFDFAAGTWSKGVPMPTPRETLAAVVTGFILVPGGYRSSRAATEVEMFVPQENAWKKLPPLSRRTSAHSLAFLGEHLFLFGDYDDLDTVLAYNLRTRKSSVLRIPGYRGNRHATTVVHRDRIYVIGGNRTTESGDESYRIQVFALNPDHPPE